MKGTYEYKYKCYKCIKDNSESPDKYVYVFKTNSNENYQRHWLEHRTGTTCYPGLADIEKHGWIPQGKEWENPPSKREDVQKYVDRGEKSKLVTQVEPSRGVTEIDFLSESTMPILPNKMLSNRKEVKTQIE